MAKHKRRRIIRRYLLISAENRPLIAFQVYDGQSSFINNIVLTSDFRNYGMPVDNYNTDTSTAASSQKSFTF